MTTEKSKEKIIEQIFKESFGSNKNNEKHPSKVTFLWSDSTQTDNGSNNNDLINDLISQREKTKNPNTFSSASGSNDNLDSLSKERNHVHTSVKVNKDSNIQNVQSNEIMLDDKTIDSLKQETIEYKTKLNAIQPEISRYEQTIHSLKAELAEYKSRQSQTPLEAIPQHQQAIISLREELAEYKSKLDLMISERNQQSNMDVLRAELAEYKSKLDLMISERNQQSNMDVLKMELAEYKSKINAIQPEILRYEQTIHSLRENLEEYKSKLDLMISERNQQSNMDVRVELAEYKNRQSQTPLEAIPQYQQAIISLREELAEYKSKLDLMISERNQQSNMDVLRAELAEYKSKRNVMQPEVVQNDQAIDSLRKEVSRLKENLSSMILK